MKKHIFAAVIGRIVACVLVVALGVMGMWWLASLREPPVQAEIREPVLRVEAKVAKPRDVQVEITGFGEVSARDVVTIAPEVSGRITRIHPRLEAGEVIPRGEILFEIDSRDYGARMKEARASIQQWESTIRRLEKQFAIDKERLKTLRRSYELAKGEYERVKTLYEEDQVGTQSDVDMAERNMNQTEDQMDQLSQQIDLYPIRIEEAESSLAAMRAQFEMAEANVDRTVVKAPFNARIKSVDLEADQYVTPGVEVLTLADDSILEIPVPLNSREARKWLKFEEEPAADGRAWFSKPVPVPVKIFWTEGSEENWWTGHLHRVEKFDQETRTLTVIVRIRGDEAYSVGKDSLPLVEGMFCKVRIPGKTAQDVVGLPAEAVGFDRDGSGYRDAYIARETDSGERRLEIVKVRESHLSGESIYVSEGLEAGDYVVVTRLINPLENTLLEIENLISSEMGS